MPIKIKRQMVFEMKSNSCPKFGFYAAAAIILCFSGCMSKTSEKNVQGLVEQQPAAQVEDNAILADNGNAGVQANAPFRQLRLLQFSLIFLNARYVEPERINWRKMTVHGIDALQNMVPEVVAQFDRRIDDNPTNLTLRVGLETRYYDLTKVVTLIHAYQMSEDAYNFIYSHLIDPKDEAELEYAMINGMFSTLDPHTNLLPPYMFEDVMTGNGGFGGCGFVVGIREDNLVVISPMEGAPAWRAGIKAGDYVVRIDDESTENMPLQDAVDRMRGDVGTKVTLYIKRRGWTEPKPFVITREKIEIKSVTSHALKEDNVGYIKLKSFDQTTAQEVREHLANLHKTMPKMHGLILDLRNNSGGLLVQSIEIAEQFLSKGQTIVSVEGPTKADRDSTQARADGTERDYPIVILINEGTASASEIVSGALQFHDRAVVVGERSFGKGSVQILKDNPDGSAIKITSAQYLTPGDISIQGVGIVPDIQLMPSFVDEKDGISLVETHEVRREDTLEQSLHSNKTTERESAESLKYLYEASEEDEARAKELGLTTYDLRSTEDYTADSETRFAVELLKQAKSAKRSEILEQSKPFFTQYGIDYRNALREALTKLNIDWSPEPAPTCTQFDWGLKFGDATTGNDGKMDFPADGVEKQLVMWVKNSCESGDLAQLSASIKSNNGAFDDREFVFGRIKPGEQREWPLKVKIPKSMTTRDDDVEVSFYQGDDAHLDNKPLETKGHFLASVVRDAKPRFAYTYWFDDVTRGNADGKLSRGESVDMYLWVKNVGNADSEKVNIHIANESGSGILLQQGRASVEKLPVGAEKLVVLKFDVSKDRPEKPPSKRIKRDRPFNPDEAFLNLTIADDSYDSSVIQPIIVPVDGTVVQPKPLTASDKSIKPGAKLMSRLDAGIAIAAPKSAQNAKVYDLNEKLAAACWKEGSLNPCAFVARADIDNSTVPEPNLPAAKPDAPKADDQAADAETPKEQAQPEIASNMNVTFSYEAPQIKFEERSHSENSPTVTITADLSDNEALRDYEAYVWTHDGLQLKAEKLDYGMVTGHDKRVAIEMPLKLGDNSLVIVARDRLDTETVEFFHVNRK